MYNSLKCLEKYMCVRTPSFISLEKYIPYSGNLSWEKTFANFAVFEHPRKFYPRNLGAGTRSGFILGAWQIARASSLVVRCTCPTNDNERDSERIVDVAMFLLTRQDLSKRSSPQCLVHVVA